MILIRSEMPPGTIGFEVIGELTADDYRDVIDPALQRRLPDQALRVLILLDDRFESLAPGAVVADIKLWMEHHGDWDKIAVVTDHEWITRAVDAYPDFGSVTIRSFPTADLAAAQDWVGSPT